MYVCVCVCVCVAYGRWLTLVLGISDHSVMWVFVQRQAGEKQKEEELFESKGILSLPCSTFFLLRCHVLLTSICSFDCEVAPDLSQAGAGARFLGSSQLAANTGPHAALSPQAIGRHAVSALIGSQGEGGGSGSGQATNRELVAIEQELALLLRQRHTLDGFCYFLYVVGTSVPTSVLGLRYPSGLSFVLM